MKSHIVILFFVLCFSSISVDVFSQTYTLSTTKRGYINSSGHEWVAPVMWVGFHDSFILNDYANRAFAWFDIPADLQNAVITSVELTIEVYDISQWNDNLMSVDLHPVNLSWDDFHNSTFGSSYPEGHWDMLEGGNNVAFITKTSSKTFVLYPNLITGKSQVGFSFRAYPEIPSGILQSNDIILNNPTLIITYYFPSLTVTPTRVKVASTSGSSESFNITSNTSWTVTTNATWFNLSRSSGTGNGTLTVTTNSANTSVNPRSASVTLSASGVNPVVVIVTQSGTGTTNSPPNKPQLLTPWSNTSWSIPFNLTWQCTDPDAGDILNYILRIRRKGQTTWMLRDMGTQTSEEIQGWIPSELGTYEWCITANDGEALSVSDIWEYTLLNSPPNEPQLISPGTGTSWSTTFDLKWYCTDPNHGDILNYTVRVRPKGTTTWNPISVGTQTSYTISGWGTSDLDTYEWSVIASDGEAQSISDIREFTLVAANHPPNKPQLLSPDSETSWSSPFNLTWQCTDPDSGDVLNYLLRIRRKGASTWDSESVGTQTSFTVPGWSASELGTWEWCIVASDGDSQSESDIWEFNLIEENNPPNKPVLLAPENGITITLPFRMSWQCTDPDPDDILSFTFRLRVLGTSSWYEESMNTQTFYDLTPQNTYPYTYEWSVIATDGVAESVSDIYQYTVVPSTLSVAPESLTLGSSSGTTGSFSVFSNTSWSVIDDANWLNLSAASGTGDRDLTVTTNSANTSTSPRSANVTFSVSGGNSVTIVVTQAGTSNLPPNKPQLLGPENWTSWLSPFNLTWQCTDPDPGDILNYTLRARPKGTTTWELESMGTQTSYTISGWDASNVGTYEWSVIASDGEAQSISDIWEFTLEISTLIVTPSNQNVTSSSGTTSFAVASNISWTATSNQSWCTVTPSGTGNGNITATIQENTGTTSRTAIITISGSGVSNQTSTVSQSAPTVTPILIVTPSNQNVTSSSGTTSFAVSSNISWTAISNQAWCTVTPAGTGNGNITATFLENTGTTSRTATITVSGSGVSNQTLTVSQSPPNPTPTLIVTPSNQNVPYSSGTVTFDVMSNISWTAICNQTWCTVTPSGTGNGNITATFQENTGTTSRTATITVSGSGVSNQTVTVSQSAPTPTPTLIVTPSNQNVTSSSGTTSFAVASNISWTATSNQTWCTVTPSGTGNGNITATFQENTGTTSRTATITISGSGVSNQTVTVSQSPPTPTPTLIVTPSNQNVSSSSGFVSFDVASNIIWAATSNQTWCTVTPSGTGNDIITATYQTNTGSSSRTATITVSGSGASNQTVTVIQICTSPTQPGLITGKSKIIKNSTETYSIQPVPGASSYTWVLPTGWSGYSTSTSILITTNEDATSGNISVVANNDCGSSDPSILYVEVGECVIPQITLKWDDVLICSNIENIFLSYQWFNGTIPIPGANDQYYVTSKQPGVYKVETIDRNGCREMSNEITITGSKSLSVYPNPAKSSFTVSIIDLPVGKVNLRIISSTGTKIMDVETEKADVEFLKEISTDDLDEGFYIIQIIVNQTYLYNSKILVIK